MGTVTEDLEKYLRDNNINFHEPPSMEIAPTSNRMGYYLISFDPSGNEKLPNGSTAPLSQTVRDQVLQQGDFTDVIFFSHGWNTDLPGALNAYTEWIRIMSQAQADIDRLGSDFKPLLIGVKWPSENEFYGVNFWQMKSRAESIGRSGAHQLLKGLQDAFAALNISFHLIGHSFGGILVSSMLLGPIEAEAQSVRNGTDFGALPVSSLTTVQMADNTWVYCQRIPQHWNDHYYKTFPERLKDLGPGKFSHIITHRKVLGPILVFHSINDGPNKLLFNHGSVGLGAQPIEFRDQPTIWNNVPPGKHLRSIEYTGSLGTYGAQGTIGKFNGNGNWQYMRRNLTIGPVNGDYNFTNGHVHNIDGTDVITGHNEFVKPEVAHAVWRSIEQGRKARGPISSSNT